MPRPKSYQTAQTAGGADRSRKLSARARLRRRARHFGSTALKAAHIQSAATRGAPRRAGRDAPAAATRRDPAQAPTKATPRSLMEICSSATARTVGRRRPTPSTRRCPRGRVGSMAWRLTKAERSIRFDRTRVPRRHVQEDVSRQVRRPAVRARRGLVLRRLPRAPVRSFVYLPHEEAPRVKSFFRAAHTARADSSFFPYPILGDKRLFSSLRVDVGTHWVSSVHRH